MIHNRQGASWTQTLMKTSMSYQRQDTGTKPQAYYVTLSRSAYDQFPRSLLKWSSFKKKSEADIVQFDQEIRQMQTAMPNVLRTRPISESIAEAPFLIITRVYITVIYLKSLCLLHHRSMAGGNKFSTESCVEAGKELVSQYIDMRKSSHLRLTMCRAMVAHKFHHECFSHGCHGLMGLCLFVHTR